MTLVIAILVIAPLAMLLAFDLGLSALRRRRLARTMNPAEIGRHLKAGRRKATEAERDRSDQGGEAQRDGDPSD